MESEIRLKQKLFVDEYIKDLNGTKAAIRAGYSANTAGQMAFELLKKPEIQEAVSAAMEARSQRCNIDADYVLHGIVGLIEKCEAAVPVLDREGNATGEYTIQAGPAMKGYELLMRHKGMLNDRLKVELPDELLARLTAGRNRIGKTR